MTHSTVSNEPESFGSLRAALHTLNITSLDSAGIEQYDPASAVNINDGDDFGVYPVAQTNDSVRFAWNDTAQNISVRNLDDGTQVGNNSDVGHVRLLVVGK